MKRLIFSLILALNIIGCAHTSIYFNDSDKIVVDDNGVHMSKGKFRQLTNIDVQNGTWILTQEKESK